MDNSIGNFDSPTPEKSAQCNQRKKDKRDSQRKSIEYEIEPFDDNSKGQDGEDSCDLMVQNNYDVN